MSKGNRKHRKQHKQEVQNRDKTTEKRGLILILSIIIGGILLIGLAFFLLSP